MKSDKQCNQKINNPADAKVKNQPVNSYIFQ
jgi:hypothetical protein